MKFPPLFIINLPKDTDRRVFMETQLRSLGIEYHIIDGRYGADEDVAASSDDALAIQEHGKVLTTGEKGCAFSHRSIYEKMTKENIPLAVILEDDVVLPADFSEIVIKEISKNSRHWEWLSFDYPRIGLPFLKAWFLASTRMVNKNKKFFFYAAIKFPIIVMLSIFEMVRDVCARTIKWYSGPKYFYRPLYNAGAYIITQEGIKKLQPLLYPLRFSADRTPNQGRVRTGLIMRWYVPRVVHQTDEDSTNTFTSNTIN
jgi:GR25 family glycosyltransferase involved in LPS biosynthesis